MLCFDFQDSFYSVALKSLITVSTVILLGLIVAYHALEVQVGYFDGISHCEHTVYMMFCKRLLK